MHPNMSEPGRTAHTGKSLSTHTNTAKIVLNLLNSGNYKREIINETEETRITVPKMLAIVCAASFLVGLAVPGAVGVVMYAGAGAGAAPANGAGSGGTTPLLYLAVLNVELTPCTAT